MKSYEGLPQAGRWAMYLKSIGFKTFPIFGVNEGGKCLCGKESCPSAGKHSMVTKWQKDNYFQSDEEIVTHWQKHPRSNYGIRTDDLLVIDVDGPVGAESYEKYFKALMVGIQTFTVKSGLGYHLYLDAKEMKGLFRTQTSIYPKIDIRANGGCVIGPGCTHRTLKNYEMLYSGSINSEKIHIAPVPEGLRDFLLNVNNSGSSVSTKDAVSLSLAFNTKISKGSRNDSLYSYLGSLAQKKLMPEEIKALAFRFNCNNFEEPLSDDEVLATIKSNSKYLNIPDDPFPLHREIPKSQVFPSECLGSIMFSALKILRDTIQAPDALIGQSLLAAASLAVQPHADVVIDSRRYPLSLFVITIGESGERKSAVDKEVLFQHREFEKEMYYENLDQIRAYQTKLEIYDLDKRNILNSNKKSTIEKEQALFELGEPPKAPPGHTMFVEEPTYEALVKLLENERPSVGVFSDEGGRLIGGHGMNKENLLKTLAGFSSLWNGSSISRSRVGDGSIKLYGRRTALHLMAQPKVTRTLLENELVVDQGFLSRCLIAFPESTIGQRFYRKASINDLMPLQIYYRRVKEILSRPMPTKPGSKELCPSSLFLSNDAEARWILFYNEIEKQTAEGGLYENIKGFASKAAEQAIRIAGVLTLFDNLDAPVIAAKEMDAAIELVRFYLSEANRLAGFSSLDPDLISAKILLAWCQRFSEVYPVKIYQKGPNSLRDRATAKRLIKILEDHGWLKRLDAGKKIDGKHRSEAWAVVQLSDAIPASIAIQNSEDSENSHE